jgi:hypothetical protein
MPVNRILLLTIIAETASVNVLQGATVLELFNVTLVIPTAAAAAPSLGRAQFFNIGTS